MNWGTAIRILSINLHSSLPMVFFEKQYEKQINKQKGGKGHTEQQDDVPLEIADVGDWTTRKSVCFCVAYKSWQDYSQW